MKYLGKITDPKDLVTKEYVDNIISYTEYSQSDDMFLQRTLTGLDVNVNTKSLDKIVGGTVCFNQEITDGGFQDSTKWKAQESGTTVSVSNGVATVTINSGYTPSLSKPAIAENVSPRAQVVSGHTYLVVFDSCIMSDVASAPSLGFALYLRTSYLSWNMTLKTERNLTTTSDADLQWGHHILVVPATGTGAAFSYIGIAQASNYISAGEGLKIKNFNIFDISTMWPSVYSAINLSARNGNTGVVSNSTNASQYISLFLPKIPYEKSAKTLVSVNPSSNKITDTNNNEYSSIFSSYELHGLFSLDANNNIVIDGDERCANGIVNHKYEKRAYQSGDESLTDAITDGTNTVVNLSTPTSSKSSTYSSVLPCGNNYVEEFVYATGIPIPVGSSTTYIQSNNFTNNLINLILHYGS